MRRAVIDQPGLKIIFFGLLIAIFMGLALRSQITPTKVHEYVAQSIRQIEMRNESKKLSIEFSEAQLLLSDWGLPFPHLVIKNIKISAAVPECADNQVYIETLDVPLSWKKLLRLQLQIETARIGVVELRLNHLEKCLAVAEKPVSSVSREVASAPATKIDENQRDYNIYVEKLKIIDKHNYAVPVLLQTVGARIIMHQNQIKSVDVRSQIYLFKDFIQDIYKLKSDLTLSYTPEKAVAAVRGKLIDKPFEVNLAWDAHKNLIGISHKMTDVSLKAFLSLSLSEEKRLEGITGLALSNQGHGEWDLKSKSLRFYQIEDVVLSSGESRATTELIKINSMHPLTFDLFEIKIHNFELEKLKNLPAFVSIQKSINDFGKATGLVTVISPDDVTAQGKIENLQFIFSNRGQRAFQKIDQLSFQYRQKKSSQILVLDQVITEGQTVKGEVHAEISPLKIQAQLSGLKLNDQVYSIFSFDPRSPAQIELMVVGQEEAIKSKIKFDRLVSSAVEVDQAEVVYESYADSRKYLFEIGMKNLKIKRSDLLDPSFYQILDELEGVSAPEFKFETVKAQYRSSKSEDSELKVTALHHKNNLQLKSKFTNSSRAPFYLDLSSHSKSVKNFEFNANLSSFTFELTRKN